MSFSRKAALGCGLVFWLSLTSAHAGESKLACERLWGVKSLPMTFTIEYGVALGGVVERIMSVGAEAYFPSW
jgi:hypothetical protein